MAAETKAGDASGEPPFPALRHTLTAYQLFVRIDTHSISTGVPGLDSDVRVEPAQVRAPAERAPIPGLTTASVVQISGPTASGKTQLLYHIVAKAVLDKAGGGAGVSVIFVDADWKLSVSRVGDMLAHMLREAGAEEDGVSKSVRGCLARLHVLRPSGSFELLMTLCNLGAIIEACGAPVRLVALDSLAAGFYTDKAWEARGGAPLRRRIHQVLGAIPATHGCGVIATAPHLFAGRKSYAGNRTYLPSVWSDEVTTRIDMSQEPSKAAVDDGCSHFCAKVCHGATTVVSRLKVGDRGVQFERA